MKKTIFKPLFLATFVTFLIGCKKDLLDVMPDGRLTLDEVFADELMASEYLNTIYDNLQRYGSAHSYFTLLAGFSDEAHDNDYPQDMGRAPSRWYNGELRPNWNPLDIPGTVGSDNPEENGNYYRKNWAAIRQANVFLSRINETPYANPQTRARLIAEAKVLRAFFYLEQIKMFGGMPVVDRPFDENFLFETLPRQTFQECVAFIKQNCDEAIAEPHFPNRITTEPERGRFTKAVAHAVRSQALLFAASPLWNPENNGDRWAAAAAGAKESIDFLVQHGFLLFPDYQSYFYGRSDISVNPSDKETIYEIKQGIAFSSLFYRMHMIPTLGGDKAGCTPSQEMVDAYEMANGEPAILGYQDDDHLRPIINAASGYDERNPYVGRDPRFYASILYNNAYFGEVNGRPYHIESFLGGADGISNIMQRTGNGYYLRKFRDPQQRDPNTGTARFKKFRLGELYLNHAEAANEAYGPTPEVYGSINAIRARAGMPALPDGLSKEQMRERIHRERRVELAFEEHRFWDVRRWKILHLTDKLTTGMEWTKVADQVFDGRRIVVGRRSSWAEGYQVLPIPLNELILLPLWEQNPGW